MSPHQMYLEMSLQFLLYVYGYIYGYIFILDKMWKFIFNPPRPFAELSAKHCMEFSFGSMMEFWRRVVDGKVSGADFH